MATKTAVKKGTKNSGSPSGERASEARTNGAFLKNRVKELEEEVVTLKKRLDELRKAKNTTILKREREVLSVADPFSARPAKPADDGRLAELQQKLDSSAAERDREVAELNRQLEKLKLDHQADMDRLRKENQGKQVPPCDHEKELETLRKKLREEETLNRELNDQNMELRARLLITEEKIEALYDQLSVKEAHWCEMEEQYQLKLKTQFSEKYAEWMAATEQKIEELQRANDLLRNYVRRPGRGSSQEGAEGSQDDS
ncbi:tropomyosin alpha-1 chain-like [Branchiostoma lanceolatum]|uniref:tropomyosin alpha-1 chain-like n=1 Tax=Branchiostoma lanceolatum TaxID=7740 RepID=UPI0034514435